MLYLFFALLITGASAQDCTSLSSACAASAQQKSVSAYCSSVLSISTVTITHGLSTSTVLPSCSGFILPTITTVTTITPSPSAVDEARLRRDPNLAAAHHPRRNAQTSAPQPPQCFPTATASSSAFPHDCGCFHYATHTTATTVPVATVTGPFRLKVSGANGMYPSFYPASGNHEFEYVFFYDRASNSVPAWFVNQNSGLINPASHFTAVELIDHYGNGSVFVTNNINGAAPLVCQISSSTCGLECAVNNNFNENYVCYGWEWEINADPKGDCAPFQPIVVPK